MMAHHQQQPPSLNGRGNSSGSSVNIRPGARVFRQLQVDPGFAQGVLILKEVGTSDAALASISMVQNGVRRGYVVPPGVQTLNIAEIKNPALHRELVVLAAPPMSGLGTIMVEASAIVQSSIGREVLTDGRRYFSQQQPSPAPLPGKRTVLRG
jgi:hypothetical protein